MGGLPPNAGKHRGDIGRPSAACAAPPYGKRADHKAVAKLKCPEQWILTRERTLFMGIFPRRR
jgi:hypothetical protein